MTVFDLLVLAILAVSSLIGWYRGGLREAVTLLAILGGFLFLNLFGAGAASYVSGIPAKIAVFAAVFFVGDLLVSLLGAYLIRRFVGKKVFRNDRVAGLLFGLVRGWVLAAALVFTVITYHDGAALPGWITGSFFAPALEATADALLRKAEFSVTELSKASLSPISP
ncbi:CvpA family protein [Parvularcula maris]|uniref:CvpA family protein n=1 Tax=Parvularcula maris TaxID=2965077 RepID=A0A9X2RL26_9PROT|nr:CvpA family protein [Parvularcula maris]